MNQGTASLICMLMLTLAGAPQATAAEAAKFTLEPATPPEPISSAELAQLTAAVYTGDERRVAAMLDAGVRADVMSEDCKGPRGPIVHAAQRGYAGIVAMLLDAGLDVNARYSHAWTALMFAVGHGDDVPIAKGVEITELLLDRGAEIDLTNDLGRTALMIAAQRNHAEIVTVLLERGADPRLIDIQEYGAIDLTQDARVADELLRAMDAVAPARDN